MAAPFKNQTKIVAPLAGSVDRNDKEKQRFLEVEPVAPLAGSVDRNDGSGTMPLAAEVAPLAGSVDRNLADQRTEQKYAGRSPRGERG